MVVNSDGNTETLYHREILRKTKKKLLQINRSLKPKCKQVGAQFLQLACHRVRFAPLHSGLFDRGPARSFHQNLATQQSRQPSCWSHTRAHHDA